MFNLNVMIYHIVVNNLHTFCVLLLWPTNVIQVENNIVIDVVSKYPNFEKTQFCFKPMALVAEAVFSKKKKKICFINMY